MNSKKKFAQPRLESLGSLDDILNSDAPEAVKQAARALAAEQAARTKPDRK